MNYQRGNFDPTYLAWFATIAGAGLMVAGGVLLAFGIHLLRM